MKLTTLLNRSVIATLLLSASLTAFAGGGSRAPVYPYASSTSNIERVSANAAPTVAFEADANAVAGGNAATGKTRAQVRAELLQAQEAGLVPIHTNDYPPSAETIARNRVRFHQVEQAWQARGQATVADR
ncbi:DUF4148 domain-containing protein [Trinickia violacea]|uniref:DUF4148 domain-containing protein n=1 Tax=Trinickia violacea TaxID=2571746 RepID=A0A4P8J162_9BURK|nr:DUF4148 domain-containing protein [Trinickia violacea]QCP53683.1 DUF4148 domain-containing protein [Trinickia violacea]